MEWKEGERCSSIGAMWVISTGEEQEFSIRGDGFRLGTPPRGICENAGSRVEAERNLKIATRENSGGRDVLSSVVLSRGGANGSV